MSVKSDSCGIITVIAKKDSRPVDGDLAQVKLIDASRATCQFFLPVEQPATYQTRINSRLQGKEIAATSKMILATENVTGENVDYSQTLNFESGKLQNFPALEYPVGGILKMDLFYVELHVQVALNCPAGRACPAYMPGPLWEKLPIQKTEQIECGHKITAQESDQIGTDTIVRKIEVFHYGRSNCRWIVQPTTKVVYTEKSQLHPSHVRKAVLNFK